MTKGFLCSYKALSVVLSWPQTRMNHSRTSSAQQSANVNVQMVSMSHMTVGSAEHKYVLLTVFPPRFPPFSHLPPCTPQILTVRRPVSTTTRYAQSSQFSSVHRAGE